MTSMLLPDLMRNAAQRTPQALALIDGAQEITYAELWQQTERCARALAALGLMPGERVAVYLEKRLETVLACFGTAHAGGLFVPINPILRAEQVGHILQDCNVAILITSANLKQDYSYARPQHYRLQIHSTRHSTSADFSSHLVD